MDEQFQENLQIKIERRLHRQEVDILQNRLRKIKGEMVIQDRPMSPQQKVITTTRELKLIKNRISEKELEMDTLISEFSRTLTLYQLDAAISSPPTSDIEHRISILQQKITEINNELEQEQTQSTQPGTYDQNPVEYLQQHNLQLIEENRSLRQSLQQHKDVIQQLITLSENLSLASKQLLKCSARPNFQERLRSSRKWNADSMISILTQPKLRNNIQSSNY